MWLHGKEEIETRLKIGDNLLEAAHKNDIDLEGLNMLLVMVMVMVMVMAIFFRCL